MKRTGIAILAGIFVLAMFGQAMAVSFSETFLGGKSDGNYFDTEVGGGARFCFDLTASGGQATLLSAHGYPTGTPQNPTTDATGFVPGSLSVTGATLNFTFSSDDAYQEKVVVKAGFYDGDQVLFEYTYDLGYVTGALWWTESHRQYADLSLDLAGLGLLDELADGKFTSIVLTPISLCPLVFSDITIDYANLTVSANAVPEPSTLLLLGSGMFGLALYRRRRQARA